MWTLWVLGGKPFWQNVRTLGWCVSQLLPQCCCITNIPQISSLRQQWFILNDSSEEQLVVGWTRVASAGLGSKCISVSSSLDQWTRETMFSAWRQESNRTSRKRCVLLEPWLGTGTVASPHIPLTKAYNRSNLTWWGSEAYSTSRESNCKVTWQKGMNKHRGKELGTVRLFTTSRTSFVCFSISHRLNG